ncbi:MAG: hypothetical protein KGZ85_18585 [Ignavibacterium sp.]|nr:hypothetical protein [Ignavibacterium sp.]
MTTHSTKKLGEIVVGIIFVISAVYLFREQQFGWGLLLFFALLPLLKLDKLTELAFGWRDGFKTKFDNFGPESKFINTSGDLTSKDNVALVSYKVASQLPGTVTFNFLKDWKVWFWIANHDPKKYKAYVKIKFITDSLEKEVSEDYYGGSRAWKLDAFNGIQAPGLDIPDEIRAVVKEGKRVKIQINCEVKDENNNLVENKFPQTYVYDPKNNSWFLEP